MPQEFGEEGAPLRQMAITYEDIVAMNSRPASFMDTMAVVQHGSGGENPMEVGGDAAEAAADTAAGAPSAGGGEPGGSAAEGEGEDEEPDNFHQEFMRAMRAEAQARRPSSSRSRRSAAL